MTEGNNININVLTHLEKERVEYLVGEGSGFSEAKQTAQNEILVIFSKDELVVGESEDLSIVETGDANAALLAVSIILQGNRSVAELSELLADIIVDLESDGIMDSGDLGSELLNHALKLDLSSIRSHLEDWYDGVAGAIVPNFEKYIQEFIEKTKFVSTNSVVYTEFSDYGENILPLDKLELTKETFYSMAANLLNEGKVKIIISGGLWYFRVDPNGPINWDYTIYDHNTRTQTFESMEFSYFNRRYGDRYCDH